jgi:CheY-like chemotaxis protein
VSPLAARVPTHLLTSAPDSSRRAVEASDNVVRAYALNMQVPDTPQNEGNSPAVSLSSTGVFENRPGILIEGSNIPVNPYKRRRSSPVSWNYGSSTKIRNVRASPPTEELSPRSEGLKSVVQESESILRASSESQPDAPHMSPDAQQITRRSSLRASIDLEASVTPGLRQCRIRELIPLVIHESLRVGGRPDSAIAEPTALGEKIEVRTRSSSGHVSQINIEWTVHPDVPDTLFLDERDLTKLISCVFLNAIKFTEVGTVALTAQPSRHGRYVLINVLDTGRGIPADFISELFKPFSREDASLTRTKEGLGLGLLVAKGIARRVGGDLTLIRSDTSGDHRGSEFEIKVPIDGGEASRPSTPSNRTPTPSGFLAHRSALDGISRPPSYHSKPSYSKSRGSPLQPASPSRHNSNPIATPSMFEDPPSSSPRRMSSSTSKVAKPPPAKKDTFDRRLAEKYPLTFLVAEDNKINRKLLVSMLGMLGYKTVYEAFDGKEAVRIMREVCQSNQASASTSKGAKQERGAKDNLKPVDVILMDLWMPEMDGYEATEHILQMFEKGDEPNPHLPSFPVPTVLAVSADVTDEAISRATTTGMEGFMTKPYKLTDLQRLIEEFCVRSERN